jgi:RNA polymerase sigma factor (sigma-70 family)
MNAQIYPAMPLEEPVYFAASQENLKGKTIRGKTKVLFTDEAILNGLRTRDVPIIKYLYKHYFYPIRALVTSNSGTQMDAEDIFQDALVIIYQKIAEENLRLTCSFKTYLYSVCRHLWLQKLNKKEFTYEFKESADLDCFQDKYNFEEQSEEMEKYRLFQQHFLKLSDDDQKVLKLFMKKISLKEIASIMGYKSGDYAKFRKYICKERLKNSIINDPRYKEMDQDYGAIPAFD